MPPGQGQGLVMYTPKFDVHQDGDVLAALASRGGPCGPSPCANHPIVRWAAMARARCTRQNIRELNPPDSCFGFVAAQLQLASPTRRHRRSAGDVQAHEFREQRLDGSHLVDSRRPRMKVSSSTAVARKHWTLLIGNRRAFWLSCEVGGRALGCRAAPRRNPHRSRQVTSPG
jgi:hypothetical protein